MNLFHHRRLLLMTVSVSGSSKFEKRGRGNRSGEDVGIDQDSGEEGGDGVERGGDGRVWEGGRRGRGRN